MFVKELTYEDFNGQSITEKFYFNLTEAELSKMELSTEGGFGNKVKAIIAAKNVPELEKAFTKIIDLSYGIKSDDGKRFIKIVDGHPVVEEFKQTQAYSDFYMELITDENAASAFINGVIPKKLLGEVNKEESKQSA